MEYIGEHLWSGRIGNIFVMVSFAASIISSLAYFSSIKQDACSEAGRLRKKTARLSFIIHFLSVVGMVSVLFIMLFNHYFEYHYVWQHSNSQTPTMFLASGFWEGQEGSFLLWIFWNAVIGIFLLRSLSHHPPWEPAVMAVVMLVQFFLCSMLLGISVFDYKIGSNPFTVLLREHPDFANLPFVQNPTYLASIDGRGLNPLLQNYWMLIHPPVLFLGFALTVVPFAFAVAALLLRKYDEWQRHALPWTFFGIMILGAGVLMGGAWAYEALSFGGFWAWDPVENASLVPWLTLVGAGHVMLLHRKKESTKQSGLFSVFFFPIITFILVLYSTFLTRSGILGDSSVHAFTDLGMNGQLLVFLFFFLLLAIILLVINFRKLPKTKQEENIWSREFWMGIGALLFLLSSFQILFTTSLPVINKVFGTTLAPPAEGKVIQHYHQWQIPFAVLILLLMAVAQFLKYKKTEPDKFLRKILVPLFFALPVTVILSFIFGWFSEGKTIFYSFLLFACLFSIFSNFAYYVKIIKGKFDYAGASVAHIGFGMILLGALISTAKSEKISVNQKGNPEIFGSNFSNQDNILLMKNDTVKMGDYYVSYNGKRKEGLNIFYDVEYLTRNENGKYISQFVLSPKVQLNERMGNVAEPDTRHFFTKDIYTHITYADLTVKSENKNMEYSPPQNNTLSVGDTFFSTGSRIVLEKLNTDIDKEKYGIQDAEIAVGATLKIFDVSGKTEQAMPIYYIRNNIQNTIESIANEPGLKFAFWKVHPETGKIDISVSEKKSAQNDFIVMKAIVFPYINILWLGCAVMLIGTFLAVRHRLKKNQG